MTSIIPPQSGLNNPSHAPVKARRKSAVQRRAEIANAAEALARESGLAGITMRSVAAKVGIAPTLVVHHVLSMDALVADAFESIVADELTELRAVAASAEVPGEQLRDVLSAVLDGTREQVTLVWVESWVMGRSNTELAVRVREQMNAWRAFLAELIEAAGRSRGMRVADPLAIAGQLLGMIDGVGAHSLVGWQDDKNRLELMLRAVDAMLRSE